MNSWPSSSGTGPERELEERSKSLRRVSWPNEGRIVPEIFVEERLRSCREEREESCGGKEDRLRNVLGREREMTLFCGEHVTPCHEHGVGLDGFHEDRIDEDDFTDGSAAERRERRACPSADRDDTRSTVWVMIKIIITKNEENKRKEWVGFSIGGFMI